jgi:hypothetical protein
VTDPAHTAHDLLLILSPPMRLIAWLETVWAAKQVKGEQVPENFLKWLERWKAIRSELPSEIDYVTDEEWAAVGEQVHP